MSNVIRFVLAALVFLATAAFWELVAWFMHRYVMHGFLWVLHEDHHRTSGRHLQKNDFFAVFFAGISFVLIYFGLREGVVLMAASGFGVALYGVGYVAFHDVMFHKRLRALRFRPKSRYMRRIINAHRVHHGTITKHDAESFSFLWAPRHYTPET